MQAMRRFALYTALLPVLVLALGVTVLMALRGQTASYPVRPVPRHGTLMANLDLTGLTGEEIEARMAAVADDGYSIVRLRLPWDEIQPERETWRWLVADAAIAAARAHDLDLILLLDGAPAWAQAPADRDNRLAPPQEPRTFGLFAAEAARRYAADAVAFQIWDEPNIAPHWGARLASPRGYLALLREAAHSIHAVAPGMPIMLAALAPTTAHDGANLSDLDFLDELYRLGAAEFFDIAAGAAYGFDATPEQPPAPDRLNFRRPELLHQVMARHGDGTTPLWITAWGWWVSPVATDGKSSPWGKVTPNGLLAYQERGLDWARRRWPWAGPMAWVEYMLNPGDPAIRSGWALRRPNGQPTTAGRGLTALLRPSPVLGTGTHPPSADAIRYAPDAWRLSTDAADPSRSGAVLEFDFAGRAVALTVQRGGYWALFRIWIDGQPAPLLPRDEKGSAYLVLFDTDNGVATVPLARDLEEGIHHVKVEAEGGWGQWPLRGVVVDHRPWPSSFPFYPLMAVLTLAMLAVIPAWYRVARAPEGRTVLELVLAVWEGLSLRYRSLPPAVQLLLALVAAVLFYFAPGPWLSLLTLLPLLFLLALHHGLALFLALLSLPFYLRPKYLGPVGFSLHEFLIWTTAALWFFHAGLERLVEAPRRSPTRSARLWYWNPDYALGALVVIGLFATLNAAHFGFALYDFRTVLLTPTLFYVLLTRLPQTHRFSLPVLSDALVLGALGASFIALYQLVSGSAGVAEGVPRVSALYGSANNLALYLGRILPLLVAVPLIGQAPRRRLYLAALVPVGLAAFFTFSKGLLLISLPAGLLLLAWWEPRARRAAGVLLVVAVLSLVPFLNTPRFTSLLDTTSGTTFLRLQLWQSAWRMWLDHPWLGVGPDNFLYAYRSTYVLPNAWEELLLSHPHNLFLDLLTRLGLLGFLAGMWLLGVTLLRGRRLVRIIARRAPGPTAWPLWPYYLGLFAGFCAGLLHGLIDNSLFLVDLSILSLFVVGILREPVRPSSGGGVAAS
ncbi:MAG: hypothetical protein D6775_02805 [Caldilineae bacterium]|nr:MAG: hypothetical protein D6775_02805 [Caldilineae bacterium]